MSVPLMSVPVLVRAAGPPGGSDAAPFGVEASVVTGNGAALSRAGARIRDTAFALVPTLTAAVHTCGMPV